jgi:hypothetical protein
MSTPCREALRLWEFHRLVAQYSTLSTRRIKGNTEEFSILLLKKYLH